MKWVEVRTPSIMLEADGGNYEVHVEGEFKSDTTPHVHPNSVIKSRLSLSMTRGDTTSLISVPFDETGKADKDGSPSDLNLQTGLETLEYLEKVYLLRKVKKAPTGYSDPRPCH